MLMTGGELVVQTLRAAGVDRLFGLHGAHIDAIFQACLDAGLPVIDTRNEMNAGHAAEGYARCLRRVGVALVTAGGGMTNVVTSLAQGRQDRTPLLVIAGSGPVRDDETNTLQAGIDQVAIATPVTKWAHRIRAVEHIPRLVAQAIRIATTAPRGPVMLDIPWDILTARVDVAALGLRPSVFRAAGSVIARADLARTLDILRTAARPIIVVGSEAKAGGAHESLRRLVATSGVPVFSDFEGLGLLRDIPTTHRGGLVQVLYGLAAKGAAPDVVILLGTRFGLNTAHGSGLLLPLDARIVQIDPDGRELGRLQAVELGVAADVAPSVEAIADAAGSIDWRDRGAWRVRLRNHIQERRGVVAERASRTPRLHPFHASEILVRKVGRNTTVVADGALTYLWLSEVISDATPGEFLCHGFLGSMGVGFGVALGAQTAALQTGQRTILVTGDGSIGYSLAEFDTAVRHRLPLIVVVMNNRSWGATLHFQELAVGPDRVTHTRLDNGAYHDVARALGADGYHVNDADGLERALNEAFAGDRPACINVEVDIAPIPPEEMLLIGRDPFENRE